MSYGQCMQPLHCKELCSIDVVVKTSPTSQKAALLISCHANSNVVTSIQTSLSAY